VDLLAQTKSENKNKTIAFIRNVARNISKPVHTKLTRKSTSILPKRAKQQYGMEIISRQNFKDCANILSSPNIKRKT